SGSLKVPDAEAEATGGDGGTNASVRPLNATQPPPYTRGTFVQTSGAGSVIAVGDSIPYVIGTDSNIYHYSESEPPSFPSRSWPQVYVGATRSLAASPEGAPWRVDTSGFVYKGSWSNNSWTWTQEGSSTFWEI